MARTVAALVILGSVLVGFSWVSASLGVTMLLVAVSKNPSLLGFVLLGVGLSLLVVLFAFGDVAFGFSGPVLGMFSWTLIRADDLKEIQ